MYFEIDDYRPDITPVGRAISWREGSGEGISLSTGYAAAKTVLEREGATAAA